VESDLQQRVEALPWFHELDLGGGVVTPGLAKREVLHAQADLYFKDGVDGLSVLDVGCWDGFNSFEAKRRGAGRVLATDRFAWAHGWGSRKSFELARDQLGLDIDVMEIDVEDLSAKTVGTFDLVLFCGVLYHLRDPFVALARVGELCARTIVVETHLDALDLDRPAMVFYPGDALAGDPTNWWGPNPACLKAMLGEIGFTRVEYAPNPAYASRGIFHGYRERG
jgi:tRNA (mo5U34)-methyltransferase